MFGALVAEWLERGGRLSLYVGLLLITFQAVRSPGNLGSIADPFLLFSLLCAFLVAARGRAFNVAVFKLQGIGLLLVCAGVLASTVANSTDDLQSLTQLTKFLFTTTGTFFTCVVLIRHRTHLKMALACWVISAATTSLVALLQLSFGDQTSPRLGGLSAGPNGLGAAAAIALPAGLALTALSTNRGRVLWMIAVVLCVFGVVVSASRAGAVAAMGTVIPWLVLYSRSTKSKEFAILAAGCCLLGAAVAILIFVNVGGGLDVTNRLADATDPYADGAVAVRLHQYAAVLRNPSFLGTGLAKEDAAVYGQEIHNMFLLFLHGGGIFALLGIVIIIVDLIRQGAHLYLKSLSNDVRVFAMSLTLGVFGLLLVSNAGPVLYQRKEWIPASLLFAVLALARQHRRDRGRKKVPHRPQGYYRRKRHADHSRE